MTMLDRLRRFWEWLLEDDPVVEASVVNLPARHRVTVSRRIIRADGSVEDLPAEDLGFISEDQVQDLVKG